MTRDPRLLRVYWRIQYHLRRQRPRLLEGMGYDEIGWELGARSFWFYIGRSTLVHYEDSEKNLVIHPDRAFILGRIRWFLSPS